MEMVVLTLVFTSLLRVGMPLITDLLRSPDTMTWNEAGNYCQENNGRLIVLDSQAKWDVFIHGDLLQEKVSIHIAAPYSRSNTYWIWLRFNDTITCRDRKDYPWNYNGWGNWYDRYNEPNYCPTERCIRLFNNAMRTTDCESSFRALCEIESSEPITSTTSDPATPPTTQATDVKSVVSSPNTPEADETSTDPATTDATGNTAPPATSITSGEGNATCNQCCVKATNQTRQLDEQEREEIIHALRVQLAVNKTNLSAQMRKLISVYDSRHSSVAIGSLACGVLATIVGVIVVPDIISLSRFVYKRFQTQHKTLPI